MKSITLTLKPKNKIILPFAHFEMLQGLFYKIISPNNELSTMLHNSKEIKLFCFSDLIGKYTITDKELCFSNEVRWEIRSVDDSIIDSIVEILFYKKEYELNNCPFIVAEIKIDSKNFGNQINFTALTPIVTNKTTDGFRRYYSPNDNEFYKSIANNLCKKYKLIYNKEYENELEISCIDLDRIKKCVTKFKGNYITAWYGKFELSASNEIINIAYYSGVGSNNSIGFGFIGDLDE